MTTLDIGKSRTTSTDESDMSPRTASPEHNSLLGSKHSSTNSDTDFGEIEDAFARVANFADELIESIRDESLRGKKKEKEAHTRRSDGPSFGVDNRNDEGHIFSDDDDDDVSLDDGESLDGSLRHDMRRLRSITREIQQDLDKEQEEFRKSNPRLSFSSHSQTEVTPVTLVTTNGKRSSVVDTVDGSKSIAGLEHLVQSIRNFCSTRLGEKPNQMLFIVNLIVWLLFFWLGFTAKSSLSPDGRLAPPGFSSSVV